MSRLAYLRQHPLFHEFGDEELGRLAELVEVEDFAPGDSLIRAGEIGDSAYLIGEGRTRIVVPGDKGKASYTRSAGAGELLGEMALLCGARRAADVLCETPVRALKITAAVFEEIVASHPALGEAVSELLIDRLLTLDESARRIGGQYQIEDKLGMGGMGVVFRGHHLHLQRPVAIKILFHHLALQKEFKETFERETRILSSLDHPNIVRVHDAGKAFRTLYLVMDLIEGTTLNRVIRDRGALPPAEVRRILVAILDALACAGDRGIVHRDVKPNNVILDSSGKPLLMDFGLAMFQDAKQEEDLYGTAEYVSPEQIEGGAIDGRADIYSLGITAFEMISGSVPFRESDSYQVLRMHMSRTVPDVRARVPDCPEDLAYFVYKATQKKPDNRFQDAREARRALSGDSPLAARRRRELAIEYEASAQKEVEKVWDRFARKLASIDGVTLRGTDLPTGEGGGEED